MSFDGHQTEITLDPHTKYIYKPKTDSATQLAPLVIVGA